MIKPGEPYELSNGYRIASMSTGQRGSFSNLSGGMVLDTDPTAPRAGVDAGISPIAPMLRAPDVAVGGLSNEPGWSPTAPPLCVEYADRGQDEDELAKKIQELFQWGTRFIWVVRMNGLRRVEVHERGKEVRIVGPGGVLYAPGILKNPVPIDTLYDREAAHEQTLTNLLQRKGYQNLEAVKAEAQDKGEAAARVRDVLTVLRVRGIIVSDADRERIHAEKDPARLERWLERAILATSVAQVMDEPSHPA